MRAFWSSSYLWLICLIFRAFLHHFRRRCQALVGVQIIGNHVIGLGPHFLLSRWYDPELNCIWMHITPSGQDLSPNSIPAEPAWTSGGHPLNADNTWNRNRFFHRKLMWQWRRLLDCCTYLEDFTIVFLPRLPFACLWHLSDVACALHAQRREDAWRKVTAFYQTGWWHRNIP